MLALKLKWMPAAIALILLATVKTVPAGSQPLAQKPQVQTQPQTPPSQVQGRDPLVVVVARIIARENEEMRTIHQYSPLVETYIQRVKPKDVSWTPDGDRYFLGRADLTKGLQLVSLTESQGIRHNINGMFNFGIKFLPQGFLQMIVPDLTGLNQQDDHFEYIHREFLGEVRCLVFDISPTSKKSARGRFRGRIWVEDVGFTIVRFNGTYSTKNDPRLFFSFDSWRVNAGPNLWLPAFIYSEQSTSRNSRSKLPTFKAQTRLWGYNVGRASKEQELGTVIVESTSPIKDQSQQDRDLTPLQAQRSWDRQGEDNVLDGLQRIGLIAPEGDVDKVLDTVVNNLEVTNNLDFEPEVRCRVLMTSTIESFDLGHTIVLSRGMIDVLPDEASLAAMLANELGHIVLGHQVNTGFGFFDLMLRFDEKQTFRHFDFARTKQEDAEAGAKAAELLKNSPYKDQLKIPELFMAELQRRAKEIPNLISPHLGDDVRTDLSVAVNTQGTPGPNQIVALPIGGRVKIDPWSDKLVMLNSKPINTSERLDTMPFEITPFVLYLTRIDNANAAPSTARGPATDAAQAAVPPN